MNNNSRNNRRTETVRTKLRKEIMINNALKKHKKGLTEIDGKYEPLWKQNKNGVA